MNGWIGNTLKLPVHTQKMAHIDFVIDFVFNVRAYKAFIYIMKNLR